MTRDVFSGKNSQRRAAAVECSVAASSSSFQYHVHTESNAPSVGMGRIL